MTAIDKFIKSIQELPKSKQFELMVIMHEHCGELFAMRTVQIESSMAKLSKEAYKIYQPNA